MLYSPLAALRGLLLPLLWLLTGCLHGQDRPATPPPPAVEPLPELYEGGGAAAVVAAVQQGIVLPWGTPVPDTKSQVIVQFVVGAIGDVHEEKIVRGLSPGVDEAVLTAVRTLRFRPVVQRNGHYQSVPYTLTIKAPGAATAAQRREADTRWRRLARRLPGEADTTFVRRVLPLSSAYGLDLVAYAWRPSAFGKQLFFTQRGGADNDGGTDLFVLDPYQPDTYAVQVIPVETMGDLTNLAALFFADANHDGRKDLLTLAVCALSEMRESDDGEMLPGHWNHYRTDVWQYAGPDKTGRPQYRQDPTPRPYLDELPTAAEVRQALARHQSRPGRAK